MKFVKSNIAKVIIASLIFPMVMFILAFVIRGHKVNSYWQILSDLLVFIVALAVE